MAGNALLPLLLAGGAFLLMRKKGDEEGVPSDQGADGIGGTGVSAEEVVFDVSADMPRIESIDDYHKWEGIVETKDVSWVGSIEYRTADEYLEGMGKFVEEELDQYGSVYGRTIDRADLDPVASAEMTQDRPVFEDAVSQLFGDNPGLDMIIVFIRPQGAPKMSLFLLFDNATHEQEAITRIGLFKDLLASKGIEDHVQSGYRGETSPSVKSQLKAFLNVTLPKKAGLGSGSIGPVEAELNP